MSVTKERKTQLISDFRRSSEDTGSPSVQVAVLTERINSLTDHLRLHRKDHAGRRGMLMLVSRRRSLLDYLKSVDAPQYVELIGRLGLRK